MRKKPRDPVERFLDGAEVNPFIHLAVIGMILFGIIHDLVMEWVSSQNRV